MPFSGEDAVTSDDIRKGFLEFFRQRGHRIVPSAPVIPYDDPTLLFTNAGMNQFKDVFLGTGTREYRRAADSQKCIRVSGKHNDLEEVGRDTYHHTFFEMLGNWSFGDYYKKEAIEWAWELLTGVWGLEKRRLYATVYETDDEAEQFWRGATDIDSSHVLRFGKKDNFWEMGETGPCGPCSEIHIDLTPDYSGGSLVNAGDPRVMEIWNLVFIQYDRDGRGTLTPLPAKHVDTGMGFERICAVLQEKKSNYDTDVFAPILRSISDITGKPYGNPGPRAAADALEAQTGIDVAHRVVADHVRMLTFSIADGGIPSNEGRGYVMRRILRRAARFGRNLGMHEPFIYRVVDSVVRSMGEQYSEIREKQPYIERVIRGEEESFNATLDRGLEIFEEVLNEIGHSKTFPGEDAFKLYDTYGFPVDLTELMAQERGLRVDLGLFEELMRAQRDRARASSPRVAARREKDIPVPGSPDQKTDFVGYRADRATGHVLALSPNMLMVDSTPFYAESGGQIGDTGEVTGGRFRFIVEDTRREGNFIVQIGRPDGQFRPDEVVGREVTLSIDAPRRRSIERNHTATHLVHEALRRVLGTHAHQQGSLVAPDRLRFDFNHFEKISPDQLREIEEIVNGKIADAIEVHALNDPGEWMTIEEAKRKYPNIKMFFGDKYGDRVRVVEIDPKFSVELCGGTHVKNTKDLRLFKIVSESSVASGIRRIEAVTAEGFDRYIEQRMERVGQLDRQLEKLLAERDDLDRQLGGGTPGPAAAFSVEIHARPDRTESRLIVELDRAESERERLIEEARKSLHDMNRDLSRRRVTDASAGIEELVRSGRSLNGFTVVSARVDAASMDELKSLGDALRLKLSSGVGVLGTVLDEKVALVCVVTDDLIKQKNLQAGKIVGLIARKVGGGGGGKPHLATAGGKDVDRLDDALKEIPDIVRSMLTPGSETPKP